MRRKRQRVRWKEDHCLVRRIAYRPTSPVLRMCRNMNDATGIVIDVAVCWPRDAAFAVLLQRETVFLEVGGGVGYDNGRMDPSMEAMLFDRIMRFWGGYPIRKQSMFPISGAFDGIHDVDLPVHDDGVVDGVRSVAIRSTGLSRDGDVSRRVVRDKSRRIECDESDTPQYEE